MNHRIPVAALAVFLSLNLTAQTETSSSAGTGFQIINQGANHRVWQRVFSETDATGRTVMQTNSYTELASGLNYWKDGQWVGSKEEIEVYPGGAVARQGQHQVIFARNLATAGAIDMQTPDGKRLQSHVIGLSYFDVASGKSVLIAQVKESIGEILPPNQVLYPDGFTDFKADVRYTYTKAGFEQDVILRERPPLPEDYGLDSKTTELQVLTEFLNPPQPRLQAREFQTKSKYAMPDTELSFGTMQMGRGKAFELKNPGPQRRQKTFQVGKQWQTLEGRQFLVENVDIADIGPSLDQLPAVPQASLQPIPGSVRHMVSNRRLLPELQWAKLDGRKGMEIAGFKPAGPALVLDYIAVNGSLTNYTFRGDTTYLINGSVNLNGTTTIEGGTVIKYTNNTPYYVMVYGPLMCKTGPYRPAIFTSMYDQTVGNSVTSSTNAPSIDNQDSYYLEINNGSNTTDVHDLRMSYGNCGITGWAITGLTLRDAQFVHMNYPLYLANVANCYTRNVLMQDVPVTAFEAASTTNRVEHLTLHTAAALGQNDGQAQLTLTNSLLVGVTSLGSIPYSTNSVAILGGSAAVFQSAGAGYHYLTNSSPYRNLGTTNINASLLAELKRKTTYPPIIYSNVVVATATTLLPQAQRDTDVPDLGYHYDPLDYLLYTYTVTNATLQITNGTAIAIYNNTGIWLADGGALNSTGTPLTPNWFTRYQSVQEQALVLGGVSQASGIPVYGYHYGSVGPAATFRFSKFSTPAGGGYGLYHYGNTAFNSLRVRDCEFWNASVTLTGTNGSTAVLQNNLFCEAPVSAVTLTYSNNTVSFSNNLCRSQTVVLRSGSNSNAWSAFNNMFDSCDFGTLQSVLVNDYNGYWNCTNRLYPVGAHDVILTNALAYQTGPLGDFYQSINSPLIDNGSITANLVGLYHFTTTTNEVKEAGSKVDLGYHYAAVNANGNLVDTDGDGIPDYVEDPNGNGTTDVGETNWALAILTQPQSQTGIEGTNVTFSVTAGGIAPVYYQWRFNTANLSGATSASLSLTNVDLGAAGSYSCLVSNAYGAMMSSNAVLTLFPPDCFTMVSNLVSWWRAEGNGADTMGINNGTLAGNTTYGAGRVGQGFVSDGNGDAVSIGNPANLQLQNFTIEAWVKRSSITLASTDGNVDHNCLFFGYGWAGYAFGMYADGRLFITRIGIDNVGMTIPAVSDTKWHHVAVTKSGSTVVFFVDGVAYPAASYTTTYTFNTTAVIGARGDNLSSSFYGSIDELAIYSRALSSNEIAGIYGARSAGKCHAAPAIVSQPVDQTVHWGNTAVFSVTASGTAPLKYQWYLNGNAAMAGATNATLMLNNVGTNYYGTTYTVVITNNFGAVTSVVASLLLDLTVDSDQDGRNDAEEIWDGTDPLNPGSVLPVKLATFRFNSTNWLGDDGQVPLIAANMSTSLVSGVEYNAAALTGPSSQKLSYRYAETNGHINLTLQYGTVQFWFKPSWTSVANGGAGPGGYGRLIDIGDYTSDASTGTWELLFNSAGDGITVFSQDNGGHSSSSPYFTIPGGMISNQWRQIVATYSPTNIKIYVDAQLAGSGGHLDNYYPPTNVLATGFYTGSATDGSTKCKGFMDMLETFNYQLSAAEITSNYPALLPKFWVQPADQDVIKGKAASFFAVVDSASPVSYQWRFNGAALLNATNDTLVLGNVQTNNVGYYSVAVTNAVGSVTSSNASLTVHDPPPLVTLTSPAEGSSFTAPANITLTASASAAAGVTRVSFYEYDGTGNYLIGSVTNTANPPYYSLTWNNVTQPGTYLLSADAVDYNGVMDSASVSVTISTSAVPVIVTQPTGQTVLLGTNGSFSVLATGAAPLTYRWYFDNAPLSGATAATCTVTNVQGPNVGSYYVVVSNSYGMVTSAVASLGIKSYSAAVVAHGSGTQSPTFTTNLKSMLALAGSDATFAVTVTGAGSLSYQWYFNGVPLADATDSTLTIHDVQPVNQGQYYVVVNNGIATANSAVATLGVLETLYGFTSDFPSVYNRLVEGGDGGFYGMIQGDGIYTGGGVFKVTPMGTRTVLHSFGGSDGWYPESYLIRGTDGNYYGTTAGGGGNGKGTVFKITGAGVLTTLYSFSASASRYPSTGLVQGNDGNFYGMTSGGSEVTGTIYKLTSGGVLTVLHTFGDGGPNFGAGLVQGSDGNFYGTTLGWSGGYGTVFKMTPSGVFNTLYTFTGGADGSYPKTGLIQGSDGNFYGTTAGGSTGKGTIFKITTAGSVTTLHSFSGDDGEWPSGPLVQGPDGNIYGMTWGGGSYEPGSGGGATWWTSTGNGTLFQVTPGGEFSPLYLFTAGDDGGYPSGGLTFGSDGYFYGTAAGFDFGSGNIFASSFFRFSFPAGSSSQLKNATVTTAIPVASQAGGYGAFTLTIPQASPPQAVTVGFTLTGSSAAAANYTLKDDANNTVTASIVIPEGQTSARIYVVPTAVAGYTGDQTVQMTLTSATYGSPVDTTPATVTILDDTPPDGVSPANAHPTLSVTLETTDGMARRENLPTILQKNAIFRIVRTDNGNPAANKHDLVVHYHLSGTAEYDMEYSLLTPATMTSVTIPAGNDYVDVTVTPNPYTLSSQPQPIKTVMLTLDPSRDYDLNPDSKLNSAAAAIDGCGEITYTLSVIEGKAYEHPQYPHGSGGSATMLPKPAVLIITRTGSSANLSPAINVVIEGSAVRGNSQPGGDYYILVQQMKEFPVDPWDPAGGVMGLNSTYAFMFDIGKSIIMFQCFPKADNIAEGSRSIQLAMYDPLHPNPGDPGHIQMRSATIDDVDPNALMSAYPPKIVVNSPVAVVGVAPASFYFQIPHPGAYVPEPPGGIIYFGIQGQADSSDYTLTTSGNGDYNVVTHYETSPPYYTIALKYNDTTHLYYDSPTITLTANKCSAPEGVESVIIKLLPGHGPASDKTVAALRIRQPWVGNTLIPDSDGDGWDDDYEITTSHTDPSNPDSNGDGIPDGYTTTDTNGDGIPYDWYIHSIATDFDADSWKDFPEIDYGTDPSTTTSRANGAAPTVTLTQPVLP